jgi:hypothetical protein
MTAGAHVSDFDVMRALAVALAVLVGACAPTATRAPETAASAEPSPAAADAPTTAPRLPGVLPGDATAPTANPVAQPNVPSTPKVTLVPTSFPITAPTGKLTPVALRPDLEGPVRFGINDYLYRLDEFRKTNSVTPLYAPLPPFRDVVVNALRETARPGVVRKLEIESFRIDAAYQKPWGAYALVDVTATIRDKVVSGDAKDELETGRLRLGGENRFTVIDGWDGANGRWFNGFPTPSRAIVERDVMNMVPWYLQTETWLSNTPTQTYYGPAGSATPFAKARDEWIKSLDRAQIVSRQIEDVTAEIERFEPASELADGIATIRLNGTVVTTDPSDVTKRTPFERRVRAFLVSWGIPGGLVVVDEEASPGVWRSGGNIALKEIDRQYG